MTPDPKISGYRIEQELGKGGMADVYLAVQENLERPVAIKVLLPALFRNDSFAHRFVREARTAASFKHPHILEIYDIGQDEHSHYIVMEYLPGGSLAGLIAQGPIAPDKALTIFSAIASALDYAHGEGFIHRDVKPDNILFRKDGTPVLCDFGIARAVGSATRLTKTGMSVGTPHYMSPEQARGKPLDGRSDLYSLGVVLYEMLTAKVPFEAEDSVAVAIAHVQDPVPRLPKNLAKYQPLLDKLLAKDPDQRSQTGKAAADLARNFRSIHSKKTMGEPRPKSTQGSPTLQVEETIEIWSKWLKGQPGSGPATRRVEEAGFQAAHSQEARPKRTPFSDFIRKDDHEARRLKPAWVLLAALVLLLGILGIKLVTDASSRAEQAAWQQAQSANTVSAYGGYLREYPQGEYAARARSWQKSLRDTEEASRRRQQAAEKSKREQEATYAGYLQTAKKRVSSGDDAGALRAVNAALKLKDSSELRSLKGEIELRLAAAAHAREKAEKAGSSSAAVSSAATPSSSLGIEWVKVEAGEFQMGSDWGSNEKPVHKVYLDTYYISKYEVTVEQFSKYVAETGNVTVAEISGGFIWNGQKLVHNSDANWKSPYINQSGNHPVVQVSWVDANAFCKWLSRKTGKTIRLPTEAEWEKAAKGGNNSRGYIYSGGNDVGTVAWYSGNAGGKTHPVGGKSANDLGIHDMTGNVWEWCADWYDKDYYSRSPSRNPAGPSSGSARVIRGGSYYVDFLGCRLALRGGLDHGFCGLLGFRPVMEP